MSVVKRQIRRAWGQLTAKVALKNKMMGFNEGDNGAGRDRTEMIAKGPGGTEHTFITKPEVEDVATEIVNNLVTPGGDSPFTIVTTVDEFVTAMGSVDVENIWCDDGGGKGLVISSDGVAVSPTVNKNIYGAGGYSLYLASGFLQQILINFPTGDPVNQVHVNFFDTLSFNGSSIVTGGLVAQGGPVAGGSPDYEVNVSTLEVNSLAINFRAEDSATTLYSKVKYERVYGAGSQAFTTFGIDSPVCALWSGRVSVKQPGIREKMITDETPLSDLSTLSSRKRVFAFNDYYVEYDSVLSAFFIFQGIKRKADGDYEILSESWNLEILVNGNRTLYTGAGTVGSTITFNGMAQNEVINTASSKIRMLPPNTSALGAELRESINSDGYVCKQFALPNYTLAVIYNGNGGIEDVYRIYNGYVSRFGSELLEIKATSGGWVRYEMFDVSLGSLDVYKSVSTFSAGAVVTFKLIKPVELIMSTTGSSAVPLSTGKYRLDLIATVSSVELGTYDYGATLSSADGGAFSFLGNTSVLTFAGKNSSWGNTSEFFRVFGSRLIEVTAGGSFSMTFTTLNCSITGVEFIATRIGDETSISSYS